MTHRHRHPIDDFFSDPRACGPGGCFPRQAQQGPVYPPPYPPPGYVGPWPPPYDNPYDAYFQAVRQAAARAREEQARRRGGSMDPGVDAIPETPPGPAKPAGLDIPWSKMVGSVMGPLVQLGAQYLAKDDTAQVQYANEQLAGQRVLVAGEALATAAELGTTPEKMRAYVERYREAVAVVVADRPMPEFQTIDLPGVGAMPVPSDMPAAGDVFKASVAAQEGIAPPAPAERPGPLGAG